MADDKLIIYNLTGIEFNIDSESFGIAQKKGAIHHRLEGEFYYKDLLVDGQLILQETLLDSLLCKATFKIKKVINGMMYVTITDNKQKKEISTKQLAVEHLDQYDIIDDSEDDLFTFYSHDEPTMYKEF